MPEFTFADGIGMLGATFIVMAYFFLQTGRLDSRSLTFSLANALGAAGIIFSLLYDFNLSALVIESFWLVISLYGVVRALGSGRLEPPEAKNSVEDIV